MISETEESGAAPSGRGGRLGRGWLPAFVATDSPASSEPSSRSSEEPRASPPHLTRSFVSVVRRDLRLAVREGGDAAMIVGFFVLSVILFPFGVGPAPELLSRIGSGVVWVTALLAALLSLDRLFLADYEDGTLEALALAPPPLELIVMAKILAHWIVTGLPLVVVAPVLAFLMGIDPSGYGALVAAMALGTPSLSLIGAIGAALTLGARRGGVLVSLLVLPLYIPVLILGSGAVESAISGLGARPHLLILGAIALAALPLAAVSAAAAVRQSLE